MTDWCSLHNIILNCKRSFIQFWWIYVLFAEIVENQTCFYTRSQGQCSTPKSSIPICAKVEITPPELYIRSQGWNRKKLFNLPQVLINVELYGLVLAWRLNQGIPSNLRGQFATLGANVPASINILTSMFSHFNNNLRPICNSKMLKVGPMIFWPWLLV